MQSEKELIDQDSQDENEEPGNDWNDRIEEEYESWMQETN
jgi:hypothetical protein